MIYAATCDWAADQRKRKDGSPLQPAEDLRYYARGVFTWPQVCQDFYCMYCKLVLSTAVDVCLAVHAACSPGRRCVLRLQHVA